MQRDIDTVWIWNITIQKLDFLNIIFQMVWVSKGRAITISIVMVQPFEKVTIQNPDIFVWISNVVFFTNGRPSVFQMPFDTQNTQQSDRSGPFYYRTDVIQILLFRTDCTLAPMKHATQRCPLTSMVIPSGYPWTWFFSREKMTRRFETDPVTSSKSKASTPEVFVSI